MLELRHVGEVPLMGVDEGLRWIRIRFLEIASNITDRYHIGSLLEEDSVTTVETLELSLNDTNARNKKTGTHMSITEA